MKLFSKDRKAENYELKRKFANVATRERRKGIKAYWEKKSSELKSKPKEFFNAFKPFLSNTSKEENAISLKIEKKVEKYELNIAEELADYFSTVAVAIGGNYVENLKSQTCKTIEVLSL